MIIWFVPLLKGFRIFCSQQSQIIDQSDKTVVNLSNSEIELVMLEMEN